ncbi:ribosome alternative rescue factor ArfA [Jinshanibacter sp. LJY008]|uniref:Ribosome alternative rescue factor ArfA n=1 Tax=Limnobaculum eriocheiris TaxID=2897391 RepID=A0A9X1MZ51_9GAMM|nr:ribosome alternative rescue factor ArfA [Limnobaculum eriocheiris]MCD1127285.1 ribosome alternative rescue factor ArfA [Limnobaculum eriocheiris]
MAKYQHQKGTIQDNALQALLYDPLFRQRIEKNMKGKGSYQRKSKHAGKIVREAGDKVMQSVFLSPAFC